MTATTTAGPADTTADDGHLTGFGGGLDAKARLLTLEAPQKQLLAG